MNVRHLIELCIASALVLAAQVPPRTTAPRPRTARPSASLDDNIAAVVLELKTSPAGKPKGEFETTEQYDARKASYHAPKKTYIFLLDAAFAEFHYDADTKAMQVTIPAEHLDEAGWTVDVKQRLLSTTNYIGANAFGVKKLIASTVYDVFGIVEDRDSVITLGTGKAYEFHHEARFEWSMDAASARVQKPWLRLALVGAITSPSALKYSQDHSPTISEPYETEWRHAYVRLLTSELRVLDIRSGQIVYRWNADTKAAAEQASKAASKWASADDYIVVSGLPGIVVSGPTGPSLFSPAGDLVFRNLKIFGCAESKNAPSEVAGVLINNTNQTWTKMSFLLVVHEFDGLPSDSEFHITLQSINRGENPFDVAVGPACISASVVRGGSIKVSLVDKQ